MAPFQIFQIQFLDAQLDEARRVSEQSFTLLRSLRGQLPILRRITGQTQDECAAMAGLGHKYGPLERGDIDENEVTLAELESLVRLAGLLLDLTGAEPEQVEPDVGMDQPVPSMVEDEPESDVDEFWPKHFPAVEGEGVLREVIAKATEMSDSNGTDPRLMIMIDEVEAWALIWNYHLEKVKVQRVNVSAWTQTVKLDAYVSQGMTLDVWQHTNGV